MASLEGVLARLQGVKKQAGGYIAKCPAHDDGSPSLSVGVGREERILLRCHAGCQIEEITAALGIRPCDLFSDSGGSWDRSGWNVTATYTYHDKDGAELFQILRMEKDGEKKKFKARSRNAAGEWVDNAKGTQRVLYRLPAVLAAIADGEPVILTEGEKDADNLIRLGYTATTNPFGANYWIRDLALSLKGARLIIVPDNDKAGEKHAEKVARDCEGIAASVRIVRLPNLREKEDVSDWLAAGGTREQLDDLIAEADEWKGKGEEDSELGQAGKNFEITKIEKHVSSDETEEAFYIVEVFGKQGKMTADDITSFPKFSKKVYQFADRIPYMPNHTVTWKPYLDKVSRDPSIYSTVHGENTANRKSLIIHHTSRYLRNKHSEDESVLLEKTAPYSNERFFYFHFETLHHYVSRVINTLTPGDLWETLRLHGGKSTTKRVHSAEGSSHVIRICSIPKEAVAPVSEVLDAEDGEEDEEPEPAGDRDS